MPPRRPASGPTLSSLRARPLRDGHGLKGHDPLRVPEVAAPRPRPSAGASQDRNRRRHRDEKDGTGRGPCPIDAAGAAGTGSRAFWPTPGFPRRPASRVFVSRAMPPAQQARGDDHACPDCVRCAAPIARNRARCLGGDDSPNKKRDGFRRPAWGLSIGRERSKPVAGAGPAVRAEARSAQDRPRSKRWRRRGAAPSCAAR